MALEAIERFGVANNTFFAGGDGIVADADFTDLWAFLDQNPGPGSSGAEPARSGSGNSGAIPSAPAPTERTTGAAAKRDKRNREREGAGGGGAAGKTKQHQVKELEALASQKSQDFERLLQQNNDLKFRHAMLEKVVQVRDHQLKVLRGHPDSLLSPWYGAVPGTAADAVIPPCGGGGGRGAAAANGGGGGGSSSSSGSAADMRQLPASVLVRTVNNGGLLQGPGIALPQVDRERFRCLTKGQLVEAWKHYLAEVTGPLLAYEANPEDNGAAGAMRQLTAEATCVLKHASLLAPDTVLSAMATNLESGAVGAAEPGHWVDVARTLDLTAEQVREIVAVYELVQGIMRGILDERRAINAHLATGLHGPHADLRAATEQLTVSPECEVLQALVKNLRKEKSAHLLLRGFLYGRTISTLQFVKASVYSYPWLPDATALSAAIVDFFGPAASNSASPAAGVGRS